MYDFLKGAAWLISKLIFKIENQGLENIPQEGAFVIVENHKHNFDPVIISFATKRKIHYLAKAELFKTKITKALFESINCIRIDREKSDITAIKNCLKVLKSGGVLGIFPEGTRIKEKSENTQIKSGAVMIASKGKSNILPVAISGDYHLFSRLKVTILPMYDLISAQEKHNNDSEKISEEIMNKIYEEVNKHKNGN